MDVALEKAQSLDLRRSTLCIHRESIISASRSSSMSVNPLFMVDTQGLCLQKVKASLTEP
jgi:hypothetical protein